MFYKYVRPDLFPHTVLYQLAVIISFTRDISSVKMQCCAGEILLNDNIIRHKIGRLKKIMLALTMEYLRIKYIISFLLF